jgi:hypothetical protein
VGLLTVLVVGDGCHHQDEHQDGRHCFQRGDEDIADEADGQRSLGSDVGKGDACQQADDDLRHQADAVEKLQGRVEGLGHRVVSGCWARCSSRAPGREDFQPGPKK